MTVPSWLNNVRAPFARLHVPDDVWMAIGWGESTLDPTRTNLVPPDESYGLFQLNRAGGQGRGYSPTNLLDPEFNAGIAARPIAAAAARYPGDIARILVNSGHPSEDGSTSISDPWVQKVVGAYNRIKGRTAEQAYEILTEGRDPGPDPDPGEVPDPTPGLIASPSTWVNAAIDAVVQRLKVSAATAQVWFLARARELTERYGGPVAMWMIGMTLVLLGLLGLAFAGAAAAMRSRAGRVGLTAASTLGGAPVAAGVGLAQAIA